MIRTDINYINGENSMVNDIKLLVLDLDGVITDGTVSITEDGKESKRFSYHDLDAVSRAYRAGLKIAVVTGENTPIVKTITDRFGIKKVISGAKDKLEALKTLSIEYDVPIENICYVGDSDRDAPAISAAGLGLSPANGTNIAKDSADHCLDSNGGNGAIAELIYRFQLSLNNN
ncbi:MAG: HAD hydrolase family protein [Bacteroidetes bacterium]|nr:HAD hydrolase family protein [Bacteroidota bacterium]